MSLKKNLKNVNLNKQSCKTRDKGFQIMKPERQSAAVDHHPSHGHIRLSICTCSAILPPFILLFNTCGNLISVP